MTCALGARNGADFADRGLKVCKLTQYPSTTLISENGDGDGDD